MCPRSACNDTQNIPATTYNYRYRDQWLSILFSLQPQSMFVQTFPKNDETQIHPLRVLLLPFSYPIHWLSARTHTPFQPLFRHTLSSMHSKKILLVYDSCNHDRHDKIPSSLLL